MLRRDCCIYAAVPFCLEVVNTKTEYKAYYSELFEALFSFDEEKIRLHLSSNNIALTEDEENGLWRTVCEMLCDMPSTPSSIRELALEWLIQHRYRQRKGRSR